MYVCYTYTSNDSTYLNEYRYVYTYTREHLVIQQQQQQQEQHEKRTRAVNVLNMYGMRYIKSPFSNKFSVYETTKIKTL